MPAYKNISSDWYISVDNGLGTIFIDGSVDVTGNVTTINDLAVDDAFIIVAANNTGTVTSMGLVATRVANTSFAGLRYDATANAWQISTSVTQSGAPVAAYANIVTGTGSTPPAGADTQIQFNNSGVFGATANLTFDTATNRLALTGHQALANVATPANVSNSVVIYSNAVSAGGTGVYFTSAAAADELVSKSKAIVFSIIF
jgi:hypothetical protein